MIVWQIHDEEFYCQLFMKSCKQEKRKKKNCTTQTWVGIKPLSSRLAVKCANHYTMSTYNSLGPQYRSEYERSLMHLVKSSNEVQTFCDIYWHEFDASLYLFRGLLLEVHKIWLLKITLLLDNLFSVLETQLMLMLCIWQTISFGWKKFK